MEAGTTPDGGAQAPAQPSESLGAPFPVAQGAGLGLAGFATTTFMLALFYTGLAGTLTSGQGGIIAAMAFAVGGIAQFTAGLLELRNGSTFAGTAFVMYGMFWMSFFFILHITGGVVPASQLGPDLAVYLFGWTIFTFYMFIASLRTNGVVALTLLLLTITFAVLAIELDGGNSLKLGGYLALITAIVAWYGSFAVVLNETWGKEIAPLFPLGG